MARLVGPRRGLGTGMGADAALPALLSPARYLPPNSLYDSCVWELNLAGGASATLQLCLIRNDDLSQIMVDATTGLIPPAGQQTNLVPAGAAVEMLADTVTLTVGGRQVVRTAAYPGYRHALRVMTMAAGTMDIVGRYERVQ
jgi:hypothetical protein